MTTGATQAPASRAATAPMLNARTKSRCRACGLNAVENREKSISKTSNIASARPTKSTAMARLNHADAFNVPNVPAVRIDDHAETP